MKKEKDQITQERDDLKDYTRLLKSKLDDKTKENHELRKVARASYIDKKESELASTSKQL